MHCKASSNPAAGVKLFLAKCAASATQVVTKFRKNLQMRQIGATQTLFWYSRLRHSKSLED